MSKKKKKNKTKKSGRKRTSIQQHKHVKGELSPPLAQLMQHKKMFTSSFRNNRLPELLWISLIMVAFGRRLAFDKFKALFMFILKHKSPELFCDVTFTGISKLEKEYRQELINKIVDSPEISKALSPLLLFSSLPAREEWVTAIGNKTPDVDLIMQAVGQSLDHQSQLSTDCRFVRVMVYVCAGQLHMPEEMFEKFNSYPYKNLPSTQSSIRALEQTFPIFDSIWSKEFWEDTWRNTDCLMLIKEQSFSNIDNSTTITDIRKLTDAIQTHWADTHSTTNVDAKHDAVFGMVFYAFRILEEMIGVGIGTSILGRLGIRTILEVRVNLKYLITQDKEELWQKWRTYGAGQAKLNSLKFDNTTASPEYIDRDVLDEICNEDIWEEFLDINLKSWSGTDLRKMSEKSDIKDSYDKYYSWASGYSHGMWGAIREACFETCGNPLHRLHRYPKRNSLQDTVNDAVLLVDEIIQHVDDVYPDFKERLLQK